MTDPYTFPAKPLSFHPAHTCAKCGHVTISAKAVEQNLPLDVRLALGLLGHREHQHK